MELNELRESVRQNMVKNDSYVLDILSTGHNLIKCIESKNWERLNKKLIEFIGSYNSLIIDMNKKETPIEDAIQELKLKINELENLIS